HSPGEFATVVQRLPGWDRRPIVLVSCYTAPFAAQLRTLLGVDVIAPERRAVMTGDGLVVSGELGLVGAVPTVVPNGEWVLHPADGSTPRRLGNELVGGMTSLDAQLRVEPAPLTPVPSPDPVDETPAYATVPASTGDSADSATTTATPDTSPPTTA